MINTYVALGANLFFALVVMVAMGIFFEKRRTSLVVIAMSYLFALVITSLVILGIFPVSLTGQAVLNILAGFMALLLISLNYESSMIKRLAAISCMNYLFFTVGLVLDHVLYLILGDPSDAFLTFYPILNRVLTFFVVVLFRLGFRDIRKSATDSPLFWVPVLVCTAALNLAGVFELLSIGEIAGLLIVLILFAASFMSFYLYNTLSRAYEDRIKSELHSQEREYYYSQCRMMQDSVDRMKAFRHDVRNHFATLKDFIGDGNAAAHYLNSLMMELEKSETYSETGNIAFDSIINYKLRNAKKDGIELDIGVFVPPELSIEVRDIVIILGNLLDNALEAVEKTQEKTLSLFARLDRGGLFIKMENSFTGQIVYPDGKTGENGGVPTSLKREDGHGYGLLNIRQSVEKYEGQMTITHAQRVFSVTIFLYANQTADSAVDPVAFPMGRMV